MCLFVYFCLKIIFQRIYIWNLNRKCPIEKHYCEKGISAHMTYCYNLNALSVQKVGKYQNLYEHMVHIVN